RFCRRRSVGWRRSGPGEDCRSGQKTRTSYGGVHRDSRAEPERKTWKLSGKLEHLALQIGDDVRELFWVVVVNIEQFDQEFHGFARVLDGAAVARLAQKGGELMARGFVECVSGACAGVEVADAGGEFVVVSGGDDGDFAG